MRAILIDPHTRTVSELSARNGLQPIYDAIRADCFTVVNVSEKGDALYLDDFGLERVGQEFFAIGNYPNPLAGRGLILGTDSEGESQSTGLSLAAVAAKVHWLTPQETVTMYRESVAAMHAAAALGKAADDGFEHIICAPEVEIDPETGKARAL